jgi:hypothetical protein
MFAKIKELFFGKTAPVSTEAPYKVEAPAPATESKTEVKNDGGTWPFPTMTPVAESTTYKVPEPASTTPIPLVPAKSVATTKPAKKAPAKKAPAKKPSAAKAPAKPRAKKSPK